MLAEQMVVVVVRLYGRYLEVEAGRDDPRDMLEERVGRRRRVREIGRLRVVRKE